MKFSIVLFSSLLLGNISISQAQSSSDANSFSEMLKSPNFWTLDTDQFMKNYQALGFRWTSNAKTSARIAPGRRLPVSSDTNAGETIVTFTNSKPSQIQVSIYNRGDDSELRGRSGSDKYNSLLKTWANVLNEFSGVSGQPQKKNNKSAVGAKGQIWNNNKVAYLIEYSYEGRSDSFRGEFIRLRVAPIVKKSFKEERLSSGPERVTRRDLPKNVVRKDDGDVYIKGIPMVDQGQKGYCVVASTARMFGYYNMQVDQHEIAQIANSSASGGTSTSGMIEALDDISGKFKVRIKTHSSMDYDDMKDLTDDYNRMAKRDEQGELPTSGNQWDNFDRFNPETLMKTRLRSSSGIKRFESDIYKSIDAGVPLLWTLQVGIFQEPKRISQTRGGHMRMIIGYNKAKRQLIFSDSWGAGHEYKHFGLDEAYSATTGVYSIQPSV